MIAAPPGMAPATSIVHRNISNQAGIAAMKGRVTMAINAAVIEWKEGEEPDLYIGHSVAEVRRAVANRLLESWKLVPALFYDDSEVFLVELKGQELDTTTASDDEIEQWLADFCDATTSPWVTEYLLSERAGRAVMIDRVVSE